MNEANRSQVFISYAHENLPTVHQIVNGLKKRELDVWFDKEHLNPGKWKKQITKAINRSRFFVICISSAALQKTGVHSDKVGFQDEELNTAYNIAQDQPDNEFTIVPVRLEDCGRGDFRLSSFQQYDLFDNFDEGLDRLSVNLGGISLSEATAKDDRTEEEIIIQDLCGEALAAYYAGNLDKAVKFFNAVLEINPNSAEVWYGYAVVLGEAGRLEEALEAYNKALEINPDDANAWSNKGAVFEQLGRPEEALEAYNKVNSNIASGQIKGSTLKAKNKSEILTMTKLDQMIARLKNHPIISVILLLILLLFSLGKFTDSIDKIISFGEKYITPKKKFYKADNSLTPIEVNDFISESGKIEKSKDPSGKDMFICTVGPSRSKEGWYFGKYLLKKKVSDHYELSVYMQTSVDATTLELVGLSVHFGIIPSENKFFFWDSSERKRGKEELGFKLNKNMNLLKIRQNGKVLEPYVNGNRLPIFDIWEEVKKSDQVGLFFKADSVDGTMYFQNLNIKDLKGTG